MGDFSDDYGGYDVLGLYEQRDDDRRAQRAKLLTPYAPPKYAIKTHWEKDGKIGVVVAIVRPDGGVHLLQDFIDPPQRNPLNHEQRFDLLTKFEAHKHEWHAPAILIDMVEAAHGIKETQK